MQLYSFCGVFLPNALRVFLREVRVGSSSSAPARDRERERVARTRFLERALDLFAARYVQCNPQLNLSAGTYSTLLYCLLYSPAERTEY